VKSKDWEKLQGGTLTERTVFKLFQQLEMLVAPVHLEQAGYAHSGSTNLIHVEGTWEGRVLHFEGVVRARSTPQQLQVALDQVRLTSLGLHPLVVVPHLSEAALQRLENEKISGVDLCGNGILIIPGELLVRRGGSPNRYPEGSPIRNPFAGRAAVVTRRLALQMRWNTLSDLHDTIERDVAPVSLALCSKVVSALVDENLLVKEKRHIRVRDRLGIMDGLAQEWAKVHPRRVQSVRMNTEPGRLLAQHMGSRPWAISGAASVTMYEAVAQSGPLQIIVEDIDQAMQASGATPEDVPAFASAILVEYDDPAALCGAHVDNAGVRWSGPLQVWLELQAGDARQRDMAKDLFRKIL
jgi:hypothetical protein